MKLNVGCGPHYAEGWLNTDFVCRPDLGIKPDVVVDPADPLPFKAASFTAGYVGHALEHMPWDEVPDFLAKLAYVMESDARVMFVGPDTDEVIRNYAAGQATWHDVAIVLEGPSAYTEAAGFAPTTRWDADRHMWNCNEQRVQTLLCDLGWHDVESWGVDEEGLLSALPGWPLVSQARNQFAVWATIPLQQ